jgi:Ni/Fe-hydrogenase subunit HybB-like protein
MTNESKEPTHLTQLILEGSPSGRSLRVILVKSILWFLTGVAAAIAVARFARGLGAVTALTDDTPWGLWIGFDVLSGVALAAGGFVVAATVYIFHLERYRPLLRPAVLTAFLGYVAVVLGLLFDLGLAWNIWRPMFFWQHHSALFEVAWCVMLYLTVLALEFAPVVFEKMPFPRIYKFLKKVTLPLVILGIMLSTLHQSSLGSLFLVMPFRLHPLWYSPLLPQLFFISSIALGLAMVTVESRVTSWMYNRKPEENLLRGFTRAAAWILLVYLVVRLTDLAARGDLIYMTQLSWEWALFMFELFLSALIPIALFTLPRVRESRAALTVGAFMVVSGFVLNRINVSGIATITVTGSRYFPMWTEFAVSLGVVSLMALVFFFFVERFDVYHQDEGKAGHEKATLPAQDPISRVRLDAPWAGPSHIYSLVLVLAAAATTGFLPESAFRGAQPEANPVQPVRLVSASKISNNESKFESLKLEINLLNRGNGDMIRAMLIDADRNGRYVLFDHDGHAERMEEELHDEACNRCHHINKPLDTATPCSACHKDVFSSSSIFEHEYHVRRVGGRDPCIQCHTDPSKPNSMENSVDCRSCHGHMIRSQDLIPIHSKDALKSAPGYVDAMHGLCVKCHEKAASKDIALGEDFSRCPTCHAETDEESLKKLSPYINIKVAD